MQPPLTACIRKDAQQECSKGKLVPSEEHGLWSQTDMSVTPGPATSSLYALDQVI